MHLCPLTQKKVNGNQKLIRNLLYREIWCLMSESTFVIGLQNDL